MALTPVFLCFLMADGSGSRNDPVFLNSPVGPQIKFLGEISRVFRLPFLQVVACIPPSVAVKVIHHPDPVFAGSQIAETYR